MKGIQAVYSKITDVIFDLDGTLIDSAPSILACYDRMLAAQNIKPIIPLTDTIIGPPLGETLRRITGVEDESRLGEMIEEFKHNYDSSGYKLTSAYFGVDNMLHELRDQGFHLHVATNKRLRPTHLILEHLRWAELFSTVYATDSRTPSFSSKSEMLSILIDSENISAVQAVYVGDRSDDNVAAQENTLGFFAALWGYRDADIIVTGEPLLSAEHPYDISKFLFNGITKCTNA